MSDWHQSSLDVDTVGRGTYDVTDRVQRVVGETGVHIGLCHVFIHHTSASLLLSENADPAVRADLEAFMQRVVPDGDPLFNHVQEGPDDMPAHVRSVLTESGVAIPVTRGALALGSWQGLYVWEHRHGAHRRRLTVTVQGTRD